MILVIGARLEGHSVIFLAIQRRPSCRFLLAVNSLELLLHEISEVDVAIEEAITSLVEAFRNDPSSDHPKLMKANALIDVLANSQDPPRGTKA